MKLHSVFLLAVMLLANGCAHDTALRRQQSEASRNLGEAYMVRGDYMIALQELLRAEQLYADDPYLQNSLGLAYLGRERPDLAVPHFDRALRLKPDYAPAMNNKGAAYLAQGDWDAAIASFMRITDDLLYATPHFPLANLGWAYYNKGSYAEAETYYLAALQIEPEFPPAVNGLARTYLERGRAAEAVSMLEQARPRFSNQAEIHLILGQAYAQQRRWDEARLAFQRVMELLPDSVMARDAEARLRALPR